MNEDIDWRWRAATALGLWMKAGLLDTSLRLRHREFTATVYTTTDLFPARTDVAAVFLDYLQGGDIPAEPAEEPRPKVDLTKADVEPPVTVPENLFEQDEPEELEDGEFRLPTLEELGLNSQEY